MGYFVTEVVSQCAINISCSYLCNVSEVFFVKSKLRLDQL